MSAQTRRARTISTRHHVAVADAVRVAVAAPSDLARAEALGNQSLPVLLEDPVVAKVAKAVGKTPGQVLVRWAVQRGTSVLPKSVKPERLASNLDVHSWSIPDDLFEQLNALGPQVRAPCRASCALMRPERKADEAPPVAVPRAQKCGL